MGDLPFRNVSFCINKSSDTGSSLLENNLSPVRSHNEAWKAVKDKAMQFGHLIVNSLLSKIEELRTLAININILFLESQKQNMVTLLAI